MQQTFVTIWGVGEDGVVEILVWFIYNFWWDTIYLKNIQIVMKNMILLNEYYHYSSKAGNVYKMVQTHENNKYQWQCDGYDGIVEL